MMKRFTLVGAIAALIIFAITYAATGKKEPSKKAPPLNSISGQDSTLAGEVVETMNSGGYTYVCIQVNGKKTWVAVPETAVTVGQAVSFQPGQEMHGFTSKTLNRTFDSIIFSGGLASGSAEAGDGKTADRTAAAAAESKQTEKVAVAKASGPNAFTVGDVFAKKTKLNKKPVVIKAKVVKVSAGIMGKNWVHLQDGTGDAAKGTNDLIATTQDLPRVGEVITMKGTIYKDKDFGSGYKYDVIMEQASIER